MGDSLRRLSIVVLLVVACAGSVPSLAVPASATVPVLAAAAGSAHWPTHAAGYATPMTTPVTAIDDPTDPVAPVPGETIPTPAPVPTGAPTTTLPPVSTQTPTPTPTDTQAPTPTDSPTPTETPAVDEADEVIPLPSVPPSIATTNVSLTSLLIAVAVLAGSILVLWLVLRRRSSAAAATTATSSLTRAQPATVVLDSLADVGEVMIDSGYPVSMVRTALHDVATANGYASAEVVVFPTALFVSLDDNGATLTRAVSAGGQSYLLHQVDVIDRVVKVGRVRSGSSAWVTRQLTKMRELAPPFTSAQRVLAYALTTGAISVLLGSSWLGVLIAALLGAGVGTLLLLSEHLPASFNALVIVGAALGSSLIVLLAARAADDPGVLPSLVAPVVILLPGGLLTTAVIELATGHIMSGSARAAAGAMRLLLLAVGIVSAAALVGVPALELTATSEPLGPIAPWVAVAVFGVGITIYQCARPTSIPWILLVLYVAYGAQVIGDVLFGGVLSALIGAIAMTPVAVLVARHRTGPPAIVSFLPAFWLLVPGGLGLVGVTEVLGGNDGSSTLITMLGTMIAIALGVLIGLAASSAFRDRRLPNLFDFLEPVPDADRETQPVPTKTPRQTKDPENT
ncbi:threonine/serine ThrE exporter family protein [Rhodoglobus sp.]